MGKVTQINPLGLGNTQASSISDYWPYETLENRLNKRREVLKNTKIIIAFERDYKNDKDDLVLKIDKEITWEDVKETPSLRCMFKGKLTMDDYDF